MDRTLVADYKLKDTLFSESEIKEKISTLGEKITQDYSDKEKDGIIILTVLNGGMIFAADLVRKIDLMVHLDSIKVSSYNNGMENSAEINFELMPKLSLEGKHILIIDDVLDTGNTMKAIIKRLENENPTSIKVCTLLHKHISNFKVDYYCLDGTDDFIVGYGMDCAEHYRHLSDIKIITKSRQNDIKGEQE